MPDGSRVRREFHARFYERLAVKFRRPTHPHYCGVSLSGKFMVGRITQRKRLTAKLHEVKAALRERIHQSIVEQGSWLASVIRGYFAYHAVPGNWAALGSFRMQCTRLCYKTLRRRSHKTRITWARMKTFAQTWLPPPTAFFTPGLNSALASLSKVGAGCTSSACPDPRGGPLARAVPTATRKKVTVPNVMPHRGSREKELPLRSIAMIISGATNGHIIDKKRRSSA